MNFDVREYAMRLAKADPKRFRFEHDGAMWRLRDASDRPYPDELFASDDLVDQWAFIGPLADELGVDMIDRGYYDEGRQGVPDEGYEYDSLLEATFAAVVEKMEAVAGHAEEEAV